MDRYLSKKSNIAFFVLPAFIFFLAIVVVPLFLSAYFSFFKYDGINAMEFISLENYANLSKDKHFIQAVKNAIIMMLASLFIQLPISFLLAHTLAKGVKGEGFFRTVYFIPVVISSMVIGQLFLNIFNSQHGLLNAVIQIFKPDFSFAWLTNEKTAFLTTVVPSVWQYIGYHMLIFYAGFKAVPEEIYESAMIDGASGFRKMIHITLPLMAPVIKTCVVFAMVGSIKAFDLVFIITNGTPNNISHVPATLMYNNLFKRGLYGYGSAQAMVIVFACLLLNIATNRVFKNAEENASFAR